MSHQIMALSKHQSHILHLIEAFEFESRFVIVTPYADKGDITDYLERLGTLTPSENDVRHIFKQMAKSVYQLHALNIYHRDIKLMNFFVQSSATDMKI